MRLTLFFLLLVFLVFALASPIPGNKDDSDDESDNDKKGKKGGNDSDDDDDEEGGRKGNGGGGGGHGNRELRKPESCPDGWEMYTLGDTREENLWTLFERFKTSDDMDWVKDFLSQNQHFGNYEDDRDAITYVYKGEVACVPGEGNGNTASAEPTGEQPQGEGGDDGGEGGEEDGDEGEGDGGEDD